MEMSMSNVEKNDLNCNKKNHSPLVTTKLEISEEPTTTTAALLEKEWNNRTGEATDSDELMCRAICRHAAFPALQDQQLLGSELPREERDFRQLLLEKCMMAMHFNPSTYDYDAEGLHLSDGVEDFVADATMAASIATNANDSEGRGDVVALRRRHRQREIFEIDDVVELLHTAASTRPKEEQPEAEENGHLQEAEVDQLVRHAILHLRVQLLELEKVWQLCDLFARKYADFLRRQQLLSSSFHCTATTHWKGTAASRDSDTTLLMEARAGEARSYNNDGDADGRPDASPDDNDVFGPCGRGCTASVRAPPPSTSSLAFHKSKTVTTLPFRKRTHNWGCASSKEQETDKGGRSPTTSVQTGSCGCVEHPQKRCRRYADAISRGNTDETASSTLPLTTTEGGDGRAGKVEGEEVSSNRRIATLSTETESTTTKVNTFSTFEQIQQQQQLLAIMMARQNATSILGASSSLPPLPYHNGKPSPVNQQQLLWSQLLFLRKHFHGGYPTAFPITNNTNFNLQATERPPSTPEAST